MTVTNGVAERQNAAGCVCWRTPMARSLLLGFEYVTARGCIDDIGRWLVSSAADGLTLQVGEPEGCTLELSRLPVDDR